MKEKQFEELPLVGKVLVLSAGGSFGLFFAVGLVGFLT